MAFVTQTVCQFYKHILNVTIAIFLMNSGSIVLKVAYLHLCNQSAKHAVAWEAISQVSHCCVRMKPYPYCLLFSVRLSDASLVCWKPYLMC